MSGNYFKINLSNKDYQIIRTERRFFDVSGCQILTGGKIDCNDGLIVNAIPITDEYVAYLVAEAEWRNDQLQRIEMLLRDWIDLRRSQSRTSKQPRLQLQKKEVSK